MRHLYGKSILVIDDEVDLTSVLCAELEEQGAKVFFAKNGAEGFAIVGQHHVDLVVSDIHMPGGDGLEFLVNLKRKNPFSPVVFFMTGYSEVTLDELYDQGASAVFSKPFALGDLIAQSSRFLLSYEVKWYQSSGHKDSADIQLTLENILPYLGQGGLMLPLQSAYSLGQELTFSLSFKEGPITMLRGQGRVLWSKKNQGLGLEFASIQKEDLDPLIEVVKQTASLAYIPRQKKAA